MNKNTSFSLNRIKRKDIKAYLDKYIIGQEKAKKKLIISIMQRQMRENIKNPDEKEMIKPLHILLKGPSGSGKTYLVEVLAKLLDVPLYKTTLTQYSEVGYVGKNVHEMVIELYRSKENSLKQKFIDTKFKTDDEFKMGVYKSIVTNLINFVTDFYTQVIYPEHNKKRKTMDFVLTKYVYDEFQDEMNAVFKAIDFLFISKEFEDDTDKKKSASLKAASPLIDGPLKDIFNFSDAQPIEDFNNKVGLSEEEKEITKEVEEKPIDISEMKIYKTLKDLSKKNLNNVLSDYINKFLKKEKDFKRRVEFIKNDLYTQCMYGIILYKIMAGYNPIKRDLLVELLKYEDPFFMNFTIRATISKPRYVQNSIFKEKIMIDVYEEKPIKELMKSMATSLIEKNDFETEYIQFAKKELEKAIIFMDEIDKIAEKENLHVSRGGVQNALLALLSGTEVFIPELGDTVNTKHMLFIAAGAFQSGQTVADLKEELQGRFTIVELEPLSSDDYYNILKNAKMSILDQYKILLKNSGIEVEIPDEILKKIAEVTHHLNETSENIGARRLDRIISSIFEDILYQDLDDYDEFCKNTDIICEKDDKTNKLKIKLTEKYCNRIIEEYKNNEFNVTGDKYRYFSF